MIHISDLILLPKGDEMKEQHYRLGEVYNVEGIKSRLVSIDYCERAGIPDEPCVSCRGCQGNKRFDTPTRLDVYCGWRRDTFKPSWSLWVDPPLLPFTELVAFELTAWKWEQDVPHSQETKEKLKEKLSEYELREKKNYETSCPLCLYFRTYGNGRCYACFKRCKNLAHTGKKDQCYVVWFGDRENSCGQKILAAEFRRVANKLAK